MPVQTTIRDNASTTALIRQLKTLGDQTTPLTKDEERALIKKYKKNRAELERQLIIHNIRLVFDQCKKYAFSAKSFDDLVGEALYGLCYAAKKFDTEKNIKFSTYATPWIFKATHGYDWVERGDKKNPFNVATSLDQMISDFAHTSKSDSDSGATMENFIEDSIDPSYEKTIPSVQDDLANTEMSGIYARLKQYMDSDNEKFDELDRKIFAGLYIDNKTVRQISADTDLPQKEVKTRAADILANFKAFLAEKMNIRSMEDLQFA